MLGERGATCAWPSLAHPESCGDCDLARAPQSLPANFHGGNFTAPRFQAHVMRPQRRLRQHCFHHLRFISFPCNTNHDAFWYSSYALTSTWTSIKLSRGPTGKDILADFPALQPNFS